MVLYRTRYSIVQYTDEQGESVSSATYPNLAPMEPSYRAKGMLFFNIGCETLTLQAPLKYMLYMWI